MKKKNILLYFTDQQRADTCGCYGQELPITPVLDQLAAEGTRFDLAFTPQPVCGPCRAMFQTGKWATDIGCFRNNIMLPANVMPLGAYMEEAGYETAYVGKWHLASDGELERSPPSTIPSPPSPGSCGAAIPASGAPVTFWNSPATATTALCLTRTTTALILRDTV